MNAHTQKITSVLQSRPLAHYIAMLVDIKDTQLGLTSIAAGNTTWWHVWPQAHVSTPRRDDISLSDSFQFWHDYGVELCHANIDESIIADLECIFTFGSPGYAAEHISLKPITMTTFATATIIWYTMSSSWLLW
jgi:hypothetical protein